MERMLGFNCTCGGAEREWQVPLTDFRHYDRTMMDIMELLRHAEEEENWEMRRGINVENMARMGIDVADRVGRWREQMQFDEKKRDRARKKARTLLRRHVTRKQWEEFRKHSFLHVTGTDGKLYRLENKVGSSVTLIVGGRDVARYCLIPKGGIWIPEPDMVLAIKLMLETDAPSFTKRANFFELNTRPVRVEIDGRETFIRVNNHGDIVEVRNEPARPAGPVREVNEAGELVDVDPDLARPAPVRDGLRVADIIQLDAERPAPRRPRRLVQVG